MFRQWRQIRETMKMKQYCKKWKQWSDEVFNAGKEIEAMKRLMLHRIVSLLHRFIALSLYCFITLSLYHFMLCCPAFCLLGTPQIPYVSILPTVIEKGTLSHPRQSTQSLFIASLGPHTTSSSSHSPSLSVLQLYTVRCTAVLHSTV